MSLCSSSGLRLLVQFYINSCSPSTTFWSLRNFMKACKKDVNNEGSIFYAILTSVGFSVRVLWAFDVEAPVSTKFFFSSIKVSFDLFKSNLASLSVALCCRTFSSGCFPFILPSSYTNLGNDINTRPIFVQFWSHHLDILSRMLGMGLLFLHFCNEKETIFYDMIKQEGCIRFWQSCTRWPSSP